VLNEYRDTPHAEPVRRADPRPPGCSPPARHSFAERSTRHAPAELPFPGGVVDPGVPAPERGGAIQALTHDVLVARSLELSSSGFITIISIIQGVALALLAQNTFAGPTPLIYLQSLALLLVLVTVFYFYLTVCVLLRWAPSFLDAFLPFGIAGLEIPPAFFLGAGTAWNAWLGAFWVFTSGGLQMTIKWSPPSHFGHDRKAHRLLHQWLRELKLITITGGTATLALAYLSHLQPGGQRWWGAAGALVALATVALVVARTEIRSSQIHHHFGVNRPPFN
jgi:hypothetical protein